MSLSTDVVKKLGVYIHIPFCSSKCHYCNFYSYKADTAAYDNYTKKLIKEIKAYKTDAIIDTVYIGGGTPTLIGAKNLNGIIDLFPNNAEITVETNPNVDIDFAALHANRLSIGLQSADQGELETIGRKHTFDDFLRCYDKASRAFDNISVDLMYALPNQTLGSWRKTYIAIKEIKPKHISFYCLTLDSPIWDSIPDDETSLRMYWECVDEFSKSGYNHYEISNMAMPSYESKHNKKYWNMEDYIGFGVMAHSYVDGKRFHNNESRERVEDDSDYEKERIFTGLRQRSGIDESGIDQKKIDKHIALGTIEQVGQNIRLTRRGVDVSNQVFIDLME